MRIFTNNNIAQAIHLSTKDKTQAEQQNILRKVVDFLYRRRLFSKISAILSELEKIVNKEEGRQMARVYSATKLEERKKTELIRDLKHRYFSKEIVLDEVVDQSFLGGVKLEINDEVIDLTIKNKMSKLKEYLTRPA